MNYRETLDYIFARLPMFSRVGTDAIKTGFNNIIALCQKLDHPQTKGKFIHVAGTNGKGSVSHMLAAILQTAGYRTGLYTSPHLKDLRERIKINGAMISQADVVDFIEKTKPLIEAINPSFFEINVAIAFDHFAKNNTDIAIIETGLGGRLDSTNIIDPLISVITNIGYDHVQILGNTLAAIAFEKAGIIKPDIPVVIGEYNDETAPVFIKAAKEKNAPLIFSTQEQQVTDWQYDNDMLIVEIARTHTVDHEKYILDLTGNYQIKNLQTVLATIHQLNYIGYNVNKEAIIAGLQQTKKLTGLHGRWETIHKYPRIITDVAHNEDGIRQLLNQLEITTYHHLHIILGMVKDKDVEKVLSLLPHNAQYYFTNAHVPRALPAQELKNKAISYMLNGMTYTDVNEAINQAKTHAHTDDLILVCGSVFLVGEIDMTQIK